MNTKLYSLLMILFLLAAGCAPVAGSVAPDAPSGVPDSAPLSGPVSTPASGSALTYPIVDTGQGKCYDNTAEMPCSTTAFAGQDAQYTGNAPSYTANGDGTVTDNVTGLIWTHSPDMDGNGALTAADKLTYPQAGAYCDSLTLAGQSDWRLPDIKTLYSLIDFRGTDPSGADGTVALTPFLDSSYFDFAYGDTSAGERTIDSQFASSNLYVDGGTGNGGKDFGVNFADGRIKGYDLSMPGGAAKTFFVLCVRGNTAYGRNAFVDNGDRTITDAASGLTWMQADSGAGMDWESALNYCESLDLAGASDWRLPNAKELQSILDYSRSPATTGSAAIDALFSATAINNEAGQSDYASYWTSTTHADSSGRGATGVYISFGRAMGYMNNTWVDVHGAGAQRSDPKAGDPAAFPTGRGPQGDAIRIDNFVRCVRGGNVTATPDGNPDATRATITTESTGVGQSQPGGLTGQGGQQPAMGGTPPQEAVAACASSAQGAACSFTAPGGTVSGTCQSVQQQLACVPAGRP